MWILWGIALTGFGLWAAASIFGYVIDGLNRPFGYKEGKYIYGEDTNLKGNAFKTALALIDAGLNSYINDMKRLIDKYSVEMVWDALHASITSDRYKWNPMGLSKKNEKDIKGLSEYKKLRECMDEMNQIEDSFYKKPFPSLTKGDNTTYVFGHKKGPMGTRLGMGWNRYRSLKVRFELEKIGLKNIPN